MLKKKNLFLLYWGTCCVLLCCFGDFLCAQQYTTTIKNADGNDVFFVDFWATGQYLPGETAKAPFTQAEINTIVGGLQYWVDLLKQYGEMPLDDNGVAQPVRIRVAKENFANADARPLSSVQSDKDGYMLTGVQAMLTDGVYVDPSFQGFSGGAHAVIRMGTQLGMQVGQQSQLANAPYDMQAIMIHEMGHALGVLSGGRPIAYDDDGNLISAFGNILYRWDSRLRDNNGNLPRPDQIIGYDPDGRGLIFDLGDPNAEENPSKPTFVGYNVLDVLYDGKENIIKDNQNFGVPIQGYVQNWLAEYFPDENKWEPNWGGTLSHIDTTNSLMSWQNYRNYPFFIEVELAALQDIGYEINRRDFFGRSIYVDGDGKTLIVNSAPFGKWNAATKSYSLKEANTSAFGLGLHMYASKLNVLQAGNIAANGIGGGGIRVGGVDNKIAIASGTLVAANGQNGTGLLISYGSNHQATHLGNLEATGAGGIAARFDFGEPVVGDRRGSYFVDVNTGKILTDLDGPLVTSFNVTGTIAGDRTDGAGGAAIYVGQTAHVQNINLMKGTQISGNIISLFTDPLSYYSASNQILYASAIKYATANKDLSQTLTFGKMADENGNATIGADSSFILSFQDNINAFRDANGEMQDIAGNMDLKFIGGTTEFVGGRYNIKSAEISSKATFMLNQAGLFGAPLPTMNVAEGFTNFGRLSGVGTISVNQVAPANPLLPNAQFTNAGVIAPGGFLSKGQMGGSAIGQLNIDGDFVMTNASIYEATIGPNNRIVTGGHLIGESDQIAVSGKATLNGTLRIKALVGDYSVDPTHYQIVSADSFTPLKTSNFTKYEYDMGFLKIEPVNMSQVYVPQTTGTPAILSKIAQITIIRDLEYFSKHGKTYNEKSVGHAIDNSLRESPEVAFSLGDKRNSGDTLRDMYRQIGGSIRANSALINLWSPTESLFNHLGYGNGQMETGSRGRVDWDRIAGRRARILGTPGAIRGQQSGQEMGQCSSRRSGSLWGNTFHTSWNADSDGNSDTFNIARTGVMVGAEWNLTTYSVLGGMAGYANSNLKQISDKVGSNDYLLGLYFVCAPRNEWEFKTYIGLGMQDYKSDRYIQNGMVYDNNGNRGVSDIYRGTTAGNSFNFSMELARPLELHKTFILRPTLGLDSQYVWQNGYMENDMKNIPVSLGTNIYALQYDRMNYSRSLFRAGFSSETSGVRGGIRMRAFYVTNITNDNYVTSKANFATGGSGFNVRGVDFGASYLNFGVGANYWLDGEHTSSLFLDYDSNIYNVSHKVNAHIFNIGFVQNF
ncbi:MAG: autotransporter outer membrane beta-barrel domain-containing protein [Thermoguttaceae bacterium]